MNHSTTSTLVGLALGATLLVPSAAHADAAPTSSPAHAAASAKATKTTVSKAEARAIIIKVHKLGKAKKYTTMRKHAAASVVKHYRTWNTPDPSFPGAKPKWKYSGNCMTKKNEQYRAYSLGRGKAGCTIMVTLSNTEHEISTYSFLTVTRRNGKLFVNSINHLAG